MMKHILTIIILLLSVSTHISAQNRSAKETLEGLKNIGVVVKYGNADGLEATMQPEILRMLQNRAKDRLSEAEVPLLQSIEESEMVGRPRLVFIVTLNKRTDTAPTILVESKLYERVGLWRDPAKEMELATWVWSGVGLASSVTTEMLFQVFDEQLDGFIKDYREVNSNPMRAVINTSAPNPPAQLKDNANSLEGLNGIRLFVSFRPDPLANERRIAQLQKTFQKEMEAKLVQAGIPVLKTEPPGRPLLYLFVTLSRPNVQTNAPPIVVESDFWQHVRPVRDPRKQTYAVTWESHSAGGFAKTDDGAPAITDDAVRKVLNSQLDKFIKAYNTANPRTVVRR